jgi:hypothetical protein
MQASFGATTCESELEDDAGFHWDPRRNRREICREDHILARENMNAHRKEAGHTVADLGRRVVRADLHWSSRT